MIVEVETLAEEPTWSVNLKRGFMSMIQLNILGAGAKVDVHPDPTIAELFMVHPSRTASLKTRFFRTMEVSRWCVLNMLVRIVIVIEQIAE